MGEPPCAQYLGYTNFELKDNIIWEATVDRREFERFALRIVDKYFSHPSYYKIDGKPVFSIYDISNLIQGLGGPDATTRTLEWFRDQTIKAGFPGLHLQFIKWGEKQFNFSGLDEGTTAAPN